MQESELYWQAKPGVAEAPFSIDLPLNIGPPPYSSKAARIRYVLCATLVVRCGESRSVINAVSDIQLMTVFDPYKALSSLPNPLTVSDSLNLSQSDQQTVKLTAGLHRQTRLQGNSIFVDLHVVNSTERVLKRIEVQLQKTMLWFAHAAANSGERVATHLRVPKKTENQVVSAYLLKRSKDWKGILSHASEIRTCALEVPRGHVTISTGRFFEIRYFLNIVVTISTFKDLAVQLPVTIIHPNSLDIMPNALAQVAASIEAKRTKILPLIRDAGTNTLYHQGQAFVAPQRASLEKSRHPGSISSGVQALMHDLDRSPRKNMYHKNEHCHSRRRSDHQDAIEQHIMAPVKHGHLERHPSCYHCHLVEAHDYSKPSQVRAGPKLPRLQVSTSGLDFSEAEFTVLESPLKKVMLSEQERRTIQQAREQRLKREWMRSKENEKGNAAKQILNGNKIDMSQPAKVNPAIVNSAKQLPPEGTHKRTQTVLTASDPNTHRPVLARRNKSEVRADHIDRAMRIPRQPPAWIKLTEKQKDKQKEEDPFLRVKEPSASQRDSRIRNEEALISRDCELEKA